MLRTAALSLALLLGGYGAASWLTHDFQVWTDEGARRLEVAKRPVPAPDVPVEITGLADLSDSISLAQLLTGKVTVVDFFYTRCQTVCLSLAGGFAQMQEELSASDSNNDGLGVQLLSISFDGSHDDMKQLNKYAGIMDADKHIWRFARTTTPDAESLLLRSLGVVVIPDGSGDYEHNAALLIFDSQGRMVRIFDLAEQTLALNYARHLAKR